MGENMASFAAVLLHISRVDLTELGKLAINHLFPIQDGYWVQVRTQKHNADAHSRRAIETNFPS
jgi:hypothetical protein